ncbi:hypothetical protein DXG01_013416 [Tephrocybe rancida]|nr:hypothetical protein DXG01_013416 [Tephrocybe rancida]
MQRKTAAVNITNDNHDNLRSMSSGRMARELGANNISAFLSSSQKHGWIKGKGLLPLQVEPQPAVAVPDRSRIRRRRWRIFSSSVIAWLFFYTLSGYVGSQSSPSYEPFAVEEVAVSPTEWPVPPDVNLGECAQWRNDNGPNSRIFALPGDFTSVTSFEIPISSEALFFLARGRVAGGVKVLYGGDSSDVFVGVKAFYKLEEALDGIQVCAISRGEGENGLGIFVRALFFSESFRLKAFQAPNWSSGPKRGVRFEVTIVLPQAAAGSVLNLKSLKTDMPLFAQHVGDLDGSVHFESVDLRTANMPIYVESLEAEKSSVITANGPIEGHFHVSSSLALLTSNAPVKVQVSMFNNDDDFTTLDIGTVNGAVEADLSLESANETGGKYKLTAKTANAPLDLHFSDAPVDSVLNVNAHTAVAPATITLHKTYEGTYTASTSLSRPRVIYEHEEEDPAGKGRQRKINWQIRGSTVSGSARWGDDDKELLGSVGVHTSLAPVTLRF